jgi:Ca2+-binding RTX toxin-like protein
MTTYTGTAGNDTLTDTTTSFVQASDLLQGLGGDDVINGNGGIDTLEGGDGNDFLTYSAPFNPGPVVVAEGGLLFGGNGNDTLKGGYGNDLLSGGAGDDVFKVDGYLKLALTYPYYSEENDTLEGGAGNDYFNLDMWVGRSIHTVDGGDGYDVLKGVSVYPERGIKADAVVLDLDNVTNATFNFANVKNIEVIEGIATWNGNDNISASGNRSHNIATRDGNDTVTGGGGDDGIVAGKGEDLVSGGAGNDQIYGGAGFDTLSGDTGADNIQGNNGGDVLNGGEGSDNLYGDSLYPDNGYREDYYDGSSDYAGDFAGDDTLNGGAGSDNMYGSFGNDLLNGGDDIDNLEGGSGDDRLRGGKGNDILSGEGNNSPVVYIGSLPGADTFIFDSYTGLSFADLGTDRITDFQPGIDKIYLDQTIFTALPAALGEAFQVVASPDLAATCAGLIVYSQGHLFYNANGAAAGYGTGGEFATFDNPALTISANDLIVGGLYPIN